MQCLPLDTDGGVGAPFRQPPQKLRRVAAASSPPCVYLRRHMLSSHPAEAAVLKFNELVGCAEIRWDIWADVAVSEMMAMGAAAAAAAAAAAGAAAAAVSAAAAASSSSNRQSYRQALRFEPLPNPPLHRTIPYHTHAPSRRLPLTPGEWRWPYPRRRRSHRLNPFCPLSRT
jgi:hypothetical protein